MKKYFIKILISAFKLILNIVYMPVKLFPVRENKVLFCSRQSNDIPLDFRLIEDALKEENPEIMCVFICRRIGNKIKDYLIFGAAMIRSMYYLATCRVCVLDSYWPTVSMLKHKRALSVIQIWHAIGKIKKSGRASLGATSGRNGDLAEALNMHRNYDYIIAGAPVWNKYYCQSFGVNEDKLMNYGLPRIDYLIDTEESNREKFFKENPEFKGREIILYAPTFRRNMESRWAQITESIDCNRYVLIIKNHPSQRLSGEKPRDGVYYFDDWKAMDLIAVCDYVITDYSAIALEAAVLDRKTYYWAYDYEEYTRNNGLNIDLYDIVPGNVFKDAKDIMKNIEEGIFDTEQFKAYKEKFLPDDTGNATAKICDLITECLMKGKG